ncbi:PAS domain S-box protein [Desulfobulbus propionicus]
MIDTAEHLNYLQDFKILYVEDDEDIIYQTHRYLSRYCPNILIAHNGQEGLDMFRRETPDIIVSDIRMPIMDGLTMAKEIRQENVSVPIIMLTAYDQSDYLMQSINIGIDGYITKPVDGVSFLSTLLRCTYRLKIERELQQALEKTKKRETEIKKQREELAFIIEGSQIGTWNWDIANDDFFFNDQWALMLGYQPEELRVHVPSVGAMMNPQTMGAIIHPEDHAAVKHAVDEHLNGRTPLFSIEHRHLSKSGQPIWVHAIGKVLQRDENGRPQHAFGIQIDITDRKTATQQIIEAKKEADTIIHNFLDVLFVVNSEQLVTRINKATCHLLGFEEEELFMQPVSKLFDNDEQLIHQVFSQGSHKQMRNIELSCRHKHGMIIPMSFNISPLWDDNNMPGGAIAGAKDISELRFSMNKIADQKRYIETLVAILPVGVLTIDSSWQIVTGNTKYNQLIDDYSHLLDISRESCTQLLIGQLADHPTETAPFVIRLEHGIDTAFLRCSMALFHTNDGAPHADAELAVITLMDITQEKKLEEERSLLAMVIEQTNTAVLIANADKIVQYANPAAIRRADTLDQPTPVGQSICADWQEDDQSGKFDEITQALHNGEVWRDNTRRQNKNGLQTEEEMTVFSVQSNDGAPIFYVTFAMDVTEVFALQRQLALAQKMEAIGQLAAGIAHEINSPIQYVINNLAFIEQAYQELHGLLVAISQTDKTSLASNITEIINQIQLEFLLQEIPDSIKESLEGINRVATIIGALRRFSHPGEKEMHLTDIHQALESAVIVCRHEWKYCAEMVTEFAPDIPMILCLQDQLNQVFFNLIINAVHAIETAKNQDPDRAYTITVATRLTGEWVEIRISDTGCGIPHEIQSRIFEPFFTTKGVGKGTGQGLAIVHDIIVNKHGGRVEVSSQPGHGTTFFLYLPIGQQNEDQP